jgi:hypothetical protein
MGYLKQAGAIPCEVKRVAIDGNMAFIHVRYLDWAGKEASTSSDLMIMGGLSSTEMYYNPCRMRLPTATPCSEGGERER